MSIPMSSLDDVMAGFWFHIREPGKFPRWVQLQGGGGPLGNGCLHLANPQDHRILLSLLKRALVMSAHGNLIEARNVEDYRERLRPLHKETDVLACSFFSEKNEKAIDSV